jgi:uncharacterized protein (TIGR02284 family)
MENNDILTNIATNLLVIVCDSAEDLIDAGAHVHDFRLYACFERRGIERLQIASEFRRLIRQYGGSPQARQGVLRSVKRLMSHVRMALPQGDRAIVEAFQKSEDQLVRQIQEFIAPVAVDQPLFGLLDKLQANIACATQDLASLSLRLRYA